MSVLLLLPFTLRANAQGVTTENFLDRLNEANALTMMRARVEEFSCGPLGDGRKFCQGNIRIGEFGIGIMARSAPNSPNITYAALMMASPAMVGGDTQSKGAAFLVLAARLMVSFNPEIPQERRSAIIERLIQGMDRDVNEIKLGDWVYGAGHSIFVAFSVERADDRMK